jgi:BlaI family penicillinase repressor
MGTPTGKPAPSEREMEVMTVLWALGSGTVAEVQDALGRLRGPDLAYNTVLTYLRSLRAKGWVRVTEEGRAHRYHPDVSRDRARGNALRRMMDLLFDGSRELVLAQLVSDRALRPETLVRLRRILDERLKERKP